MADMSNLSADLADLIADLVGSTLDAATELVPLSDDEKARIADIIKALDPEAQELETEALIGAIEELEVAELEARGADPADWEQLDSELETNAVEVEFRGAEANNTGGPKSIGSIGVTDRLAAAMPIHPNFLFHVLIGTDPIGSFSAISGIEVNHTPFEYYEGGKNDGPLLMVDKVNTGTVTLKSGTLWLNAFGAWFDALQVGVKNRKTVTILHLDRMRMPIRIYTLTKCFPTKWTAAPLDSAQSQVTLDELTLRFEKISTVAVPVSNLSIW